MGIIIDNTVQISKANRATALTALKDHFAYEVDPDSKSLKETMEELEIVVENAPFGALRITGVLNDNWYSLQEALEALAGQLDDGELSFIEGENVTKMVFEGGKVSTDVGKVVFDRDNVRIAEDVVKNWVSGIVGEDVGRLSLEEVETKLLETPAEDVESLNLDELVEAIVGELDEAGSNDHY
jgi:hypothetical protein